jgi:predicted dienelactone hydrolase
MKRFALMFAAALAAYVVPASAQSYQAGMIELSIPDPKGQRDLKGLLWFPTEAKGPLHDDFKSAVWVGTPVVKNALPMDGQFPLVVVSHGMFGNADNQAWFAAAMARRGYVVAAINHPGTSTWSRDPDQRRQLWERPKDISRVLDYATTSAKLSALVDPARVFVAGHSLGGFTAALLAGARYDASGLKRFCDKSPEELTCNILADWDIARTAEDIVQMEADLSDPRIKAFATFDLGGTQSFSKASLGQVRKPMLVFGASLMDSGLTLDIESRALIQALPPKVAMYIEPETLSHFDFLGECKPGGFEILKREEPGDEIICRNGGAQRAAKHDLIIATVDGFFSRR